MLGVYPREAAIWAAFSLLFAYKEITLLAISWVISFLSS
ncbi:unnamed protein product, partial [marine sediment metagenome]